jgi:hypothetical protein
VLVHASVTIGGDRPDGKSDTVRWSGAPASGRASLGHYLGALPPLTGRERRSNATEYVTFGRVVVPPFEVPAAWSEWAQRAR